MLVPNSNSERNLPRVREFNPCHEPDSGRFATKGACSDAGATPVESVLNVLRNHYQEWKQRTGRTGWTAFLTSRKKDWNRSVRTFKEHNPCHDPDTGRFTYRGQGNCAFEELEKVDTLAQYKRGGVWAPHRKQKHDEIVRRSQEGVPKSPNPTVYMLGGGPAAGKTSMLNSGRLRYPAKGQAVWADPDQVKFEMTEFQALVMRGNPLAAPYVHRESSEVGKRIINEAIETGRDVVIDGIGDNGIDELSTKLLSYRNRGYRVVANYASNDVSTAIRLADGRDRKVPHIIVRTGHKGVSQVVPKAIKRGLYDELNVWDTNDLDNPKLIASARGKRLTVHDSARWHRFLMKGR